MLAWFAETTVVAGALAALAALIGRFGRLGPAARHALWLLVLLKLLTPPLLRWPRIEAPRAAIAAAQAPAPATVETLAESEPAAGLAYPINVVPTDDWWEIADPEPIPEPPPPAVDWAAIREAAEIWALRVWAAGAILTAAGNAWRIARFRRQIGRPSEAPAWLGALVEVLARRFGLRPPRLAVVDGVDSPLIWCLGRPSLLVPKALVGRLAPDRWPGIVAHELAHLRRRDHWVSRLVLLAGLVWWWNPLYWLVRRRLEAEAELACDAWAVAVLPEKRRLYAEALIDVCESLAEVRMPAPALGVGGGPGRFFERRLTMILNGKVPHRVPGRGLVALGLLATLAAPAWSRGQQAGSGKKEAEKAEVRVYAVPETPAPLEFQYYLPQGSIDPKDLEQLKKLAPGSFKVEDLERLKKLAPGSVKAEDLEWLKQFPVDARYWVELGNQGAMVDGNVFIFEDDPKKDDDDDDDDDDDADKEGKRKQKARRVEIRVEQEVQKAKEQLKKAQGEMNKDREKIERDLKEAREDLAEAEAAMRKTRDRLNEELRAAAARVAKARAQVAQLQVQAGRRDMIIRRFDLQPQPLSQGQPRAIELRPGQLNPLFRARALPPGGDVDRRLNELEKKFDKILDELKDLKKQQGAETPKDGKEEARRLPGRFLQSQHVFNHAIGAAF